MEIEKWEIIKKNKNVGKHIIIIKFLMEMFLKKIIKFINEFILF